MKPTDNSQITMQQPEKWSDGEMEKWRNVMNNRRNKNRGYQQLRVWQDAIELYALTAGVLRRLPYEVKRVGSQGFASADSVHRNIAEGYCRRSIKEYLQFLYIALGSLGESVSGYHALHAASQISDDDFEALDSHSYKLENGLLRLVESIERKKENGDWIDSLVVKEEEEEEGVME